MCVPALTWQRSVDRHVTRQQEDSAPRIAPGNAWPLPAGSPMGRLPGRLPTCRHAASRRGRGRLHGPKRRLAEVEGDVEGAYRATTRDRHLHRPSTAASTARPVFEAVPAGLVRPASHRGRSSSHRPPARHRHDTSPFHASGAARAGWRRATVISQLVPPRWRRGWPGRL
ncbi:hypothetical protein EJ04DRAFT_606536, partial [Polyplosphaeria fusca]